jgi:hypothetical protein
MNPTQVILGGSIIIITVGIVNALQKNKPLTPVFAGGVGVLLIASLIQAFGGEAEKLAMGFVGLAATAVILTDGPALFDALKKVQGV